MAYRDHERALDEHLEQLRDAADEREARITPALLEQLDAKEREALEDQAQATTADDRDRARGALEGYVAALDALIAKAPTLDASFNRLSHRPPKAETPSFSYDIPDIHEKLVQTIRGHVHEQIVSLDAQARLLDRRAGYFERESHPYLVHAMFYAEEAPIRYRCLVRVTTGDGFSMPAICVRHQLMVGLRPSTPTLTVAVAAWGSGVLRRLRLVEDHRVGDDAFDDDFVVQGTGSAARSVLVPGVRAALERLRSHAVHLDLGPGRGVVEWMTRRARGEACLTAAVDLAIGLRHLPPRLLLREPSIPGVRSPP